MEVSEDILHDLAKIAGKLRSLSGEAHKFRISHLRILKIVGELTTAFDCLFKDIQRRNGVKA
jgi:hypothetical protein